MKLIIDISHPAHYHFFKKAISEWRKQGHSLLIVSRDKDINLELLDSAGIEHKCLSTHRPGVLGLASELVVHESRLFKLIRQFRPDALLQIGGTFIVHVGKLTGVPSIVFYDTENAALSNAITYPFADAICTPVSYKGDLGRKQVRYAGYQELAYLHPNRFSPDETVLEQAGLKRGEIFSLLRFVGWSSSHDINLRGFSAEGKRSLVEKLLTFGRVFISSEEPLPEALAPYALSIPKSRIHHLLGFASLYVGESATMASEAAILGIPAIFVSPVGRGYTDELEEKFGLVYNYSNRHEAAAIERCVELLSKKDLKPHWRTKRDLMLRDRIDVTAWMLGFVEDFVSGALRQ